MCNSNNLLYSPKPHEYRAYRADGTKVVKGDKLVTGDRVWDFVSCTHPRKIFVENLEDPKGPRMWPNRMSQEFYASVFNLGIYDVTDSCWSFEPSWTHSDIEPGTDKLTDADVWASYDKNVQADKFPNSAQDIAELVEMDKEAPLHGKTDMWDLVDKLYQRVTQCDGTVILTPRGKSDNLEEASEANLPWVSPGPSESEIAEQADRVRRADAWVETGVWEKSDEPYKHYDLGNQGNRETYVDSDGTYTEDDQGNWSKVGETDIADDDDKAELIRESDEQAELNETDKANDK